MMDATPTAPVRKRRWLRRSLLSMIAIVVAAFVLAPSLLEWFPELRNRAARGLVGKLNGDVVVDSLSAGWFQPVVIRGVHVVHPSGESLLNVDRIESDRALWRMMWTPSDMGTFRVERPSVSLALRADGNSFGDVFAPLASAPKPPKGLNLGAKVRIIDGTFRCRSNEYAEPWEIDGINAGIGWRPASLSVSGKPELLVDRGLLLDHEVLSVGLCHDLLSYIAPVLARIAHVQGAVSIELDDWRLPWNDFASGQLSGRVTMHTVDAAPGALVQQLFGSLTTLPLIRQLTSTWRLPAGVQLARESEIPFELVAGRIHHEGMQFSLVGLVDVRTDGFVGLDRSLDLTASLGFHPPNPAERRLAVLRVLTTQSWPVKIRGVLGMPEIDLSPLGDAGVDLAGRTLDDIRAGRPSLGADAFRALNDLGIPIGPDEVKRLFELTRPTPKGTAMPPDVPSPPLPPTSQNATVPPAAPTSTAPLGSVPSDAAPLDAAAGPPSLIPPNAVQGLEIAVDVLQAIRERREAALREAANLPPGEQPPVRRPLLRQGLRSLFEAPPPAPVPPPPPPAPTATGTEL